MAGKRQHFIPQFMQKGFLTRSRREQSFTCVYRKDEPPFHANIKNVGVEGFFYSADENDADVAITAAEHDFSRIVDNLRRGHQEALQDSVRLAELLAHLEVRTRHVRQSFLSTGANFICAFLDMMSDPMLFGPYVRQAIVNDPSLLRDSLSTELQKHGVPQQLLPEVLRRAEPLLDQVLPSVITNLSAVAATLRPKLTTTLQGAAKLGHVRALEQNISPAKKAEAFSKLHFHVARHPGASLLLGDSLVVFHTKGARPFKPFLDKDEDLHAVILPIASDAALVGATQGYVPDLDQLPLEVARCSLECFIACEESDRNSRLSSKIGENSHLLSETEFNEILEPLLRGWPSIT